MPGHAGINPFQANPVRRGKTSFEENPHIASSPSRERDLTQEKELVNTNKKNLREYGSMQKQPWTFPGKKIIALS